MANVYAVRVFEHGVQRGVALRVPARSALEAMNQVESRLGLKPAMVRIDDETGRMTVVDWHGYEFKAKRLQ
jgi:hypothetical protein